MMQTSYDVIVVGGGPSGLSAAIYMARAQFSVLVVEKEAIGGQITLTSEIVNYPGVSKTSGKQLTEEMRKQAEAFGADFLMADVEELKIDEELKVIKTSKGEYQSGAVVLATGANPRRLGFPGESKFQGRGVAFCATCDGEFFKGMEVFVIGGGFAAAEEAIFLTKYATKVHMIIREPDFTCAKSIADEVRAHDKIDIVYNTEVVEAIGDTQLESVIFKNNETDEQTTYENKDSFGIFVFAGYVPANGLFKDKIELNPQGYVVTDANQKTNVDGVYAIGDVCVKDLRQVVTAVSDGAVAATALERALPPILEKLNLETKKPVAKKVVEEQSVEVSGDDGVFVTAAIRAQLEGVYSKLTSDLVFHTNFDDSSLSKEMKVFMDEFTSISERLSYIQSSDEEASTIALFDKEGNDLRLRYHAVPGGHEFNSFVLAVYNAVGPGQALDESDMEAIKAISMKKNIKVLISLSCTMCPEVVMGAQRIALENSNVNVDIYDLQHYPELKEKYKVMSVPCMIVDDNEVHFGKKDLTEITSILNA